MALNDNAGNEIFSINAETGDRGTMHIEDYANEDAESELKYSARQRDTSNKSAKHSDAAAQPDVIATTVDAEFEVAPVEDETPESDAQSEPVIMAEPVDEPTGGGNSAGAAKGKRRTNASASKKPSGKKKKSGAKTGGKADGDKAEPNSESKKEPRRTPKKRSIPIGSRVKNVDGAQIITAPKPKQHKNHAVLIIGILLFVGVVGLGVLGRMSTLTGIAGRVLGPVQNVAVQLTEKVNGVIGSLRSGESLADELADAQRQLAAQSVQMARYDDLVAENERLLGLMDTYDKYAQYEPMFAKVTGKDTSNWFNSFTINKGSADGVTEGMTVMSADGVVGRVQEVNTRFSKVLAIIDGTSGVAALIERNRDNGVVRGMVGSSDTGELLQMNYLPDVSDIRTGDTVLTSGLDGVFPKGLPIGTVTQISRQASTISQYVIVTPLADFQHIEEVILLKPQADQ